MTDATNKTIDAIAKLIALTRNGSLTWSPIDPAYIKANYPNVAISSAFTTNYANKTLRIYKGTTERESTTFPGLSALEDMLPRWTSRVTLDITDNNNNVIWQFPHARILNDLMSCVQYKAANIDEFIEKLTNEAA